MKNRVILIGIILIAILWLLSGKKYYGQPILKFDYGNSAIQVQDIQAYSNSMTFTVQTDIDYAAVSDMEQLQIKCDVYASKLLSTWEVGEVSSGQFYGFFDNNGKLAAHVGINSIGLKHRFIKIILCSKTEDDWKPVEVSWSNFYFPQREIRYFTFEHQKSPIKVTCSNKRELSFRIDGFENQIGPEIKVICHNGVIIADVEDSYGHASSKRKYYTFVLKDEVNIDDIQEIIVEKIRLEEK